MEHGEDLLLRIVGDTDAVVSHTDRPDPCAGVMVASDVNTRLHAGLDVLDGVSDHVADDVTEEPRVHPQRRQVAVGDLEVVVEEEIASSAAT